MGHGGCKTGTMATGIYLVELKYYDDHKNKATAGVKQKQGKVSSGWGNQKQKKVKPNKPVGKEASDIGDDKDVSDSDEENDDEDLMLVERNGSQMSGSTMVTVTQPCNIANASNASTGPLILALAGLDNNEYKFVVMDIYINAKSQGICCWKVSNEYFC